MTPKAEGLAQPAVATTGSIAQAKPRPKNRPPAVKHLVISTMKNHFYRRYPTNRNGNAQASKQQNQRQPSTPGVNENEPAKSIINHTRARHHLPQQCRHTALAKMPNIAMPWVLPQATRILPKHRENHQPRYAAHHYHQQINLPNQTGPVTTATKHNITSSKLQRPHGSKLHVNEKN
ncbi:MAG: hypothetical protein H6676_05575 [Thermoflexaceae bacterium]|nr:hypothetical protein [Thermoflexaceae bacterium]